MSSLGNEVGVDQKTIASWISVLEASFIIYLLRPYHRNWNKRIVKQPKLYFYDTGLLCSLLGLRRASELETHHMRGSIFECMVITEHLKQQYHQGRRPSAYFWRDHSCHEIDLLIENASNLRAIEIKSGTTLHPVFFEGLKWFAKQADLPASACALVYGGGSRQSRAAGEVYPWWDAVMETESTKAQGNEIRIE